MPMDFTAHAPIHRLAVYASVDVRAVSGANDGDGISFANDLVLDDVYRLTKEAQAEWITVQRTSEAAVFSVSAPCGARAGARLHLDSAITLIDGDACVTEALILVDVDPAGHAKNVYLLPLAPLKTCIDYHLIGINQHRPADKLALLACASFAEGTHITLACGTQRRIEDLSPQDVVLTRDDGVQPIRWIGQSTLRALGAFAPICITAGVLGNANDLIVSPEHRLLEYQRPTGLGTGRAGRWVRARDLVNGTSVKVHQGGFVEYYQLLFDSHQIVYAEGIAAEAMLFGDRAHARPGTHRPQTIATKRKTQTPASGPYAERFKRTATLTRLRQAAGG